jgi:NAD(P)-dependent dehydrogenase (short-subunit alcohol dehydrogenase family)
LVSQCYQIVSLHRKNNILHDKQERCYTCYMCSVPVQETVKDHGAREAWTCSECTQINMEKRNATYNLTGKIAVVTGGRIKIGFHTALYLLRFNATVIVTTRFREDAVMRYKKEPDYEQWKERLFVVQCDFLYLSQVDSFIKWVYSTFRHLDYLINNAAQTLARPAEFYNYIAYNSSNAFLKPPTCDESALTSKYFPMGQLDEHDQQIDLRPINSFTESIEDVNITDLVDVMTINSVVPFYIIQKFIALLSKSTGAHIINVSSMEGKFNRPKTHLHPHTNMGKASLNMITKTCGEYLKKSYNIILVSVDTGWNTIEEPLSYDKSAPLDCIDGAIRILDPIVCNLTRPGVFYKDFKLTSW